MITLNNEFSLLLMVIKGWELTELPKKEEESDWKYLQRYVDYMTGVENSNVGSFLTELVTKLIGSKEIVMGITDLFLFSDTIVKQDITTKFYGMLKNIQVKDKITLTLNDGDIVAKQMVYA